MVVDGGRGRFTGKNAVIDVAKVDSNGAQIGLGCTKVDVYLRRWVHSWCKCGYTDGAYVGVSGANMGTQMMPMWVSVMQMWEYKRHKCACIGHGNANVSCMVIQVLQASNLRQINLHLFQHKFQKNIKHCSVRYIYPLHLSISFLSQILQFTCLNSTCQYIITIYNYNILNLRLCYFIWYNT